MSFGLGFDGRGVVFSVERNLKETLIRLK